MTDDRKFYHSFPRPRAGETREDLVSKGISILNSIKATGLLLAPEIVRWDTPVSIGSPSPILIQQSRISFTELSEPELAAHSSHFGLFSLEFEIDDLRREGALPVIYMPQPFSEKDVLALLGAIVVSHLGNIKYTINQLHNLAQVSDPARVLKMDFPGIENANQVAENYTLHLNNIDEANRVVRTVEIPAKTIRDFLNYLGFRNAPFESMIGALSLTQSLFYPTDNQHLDEAMAYYRQREWRITAGYNINTLPRGRELSADEKNVVMEIDPKFWGREETIGTETYKRIDKAVALNQFREKPPVEYIKRVLVPAEALELARPIFGDRVSEAPSPNGISFS